MTPMAYHRRTRAPYHYAIRRVKARKRSIKETKFGIVNKLKRSQGIYGKKLTERAIIHVVCAMVVGA